MVIENVWTMRGICVLQNWCCYAIVLADRDISSVG